MRDKSTIKFMIPVPWSPTPACIEACGHHAVAVAGIVAVAIFLILVLN